MRRGIGIGRLTRMRSTSTACRGLRYLTRQINGLKTSVGSSKRCRWISTLNSSQASSQSWWWWCDGIESTIDNSGRTPRLAAGVIRTLGIRSHLIALTNQAISCATSLRGSVCLSVRPSVQCSASVTVRDCLRVSPCVSELFSIVDRETYSSGRPHGTSR